MSSENNIRVGIAGNALVVSFLSAEAPRMWRTDLAQLLTAALEVQDNQGKYTLVMKRGGAPTDEIATFARKDDAVKGLQLITETLLGGQETAASPSKKASLPKRILKLLLRIFSWFCMFVVVLNFIMVISSRHLSHSAGDNFTKVPAAQTGVPTPADDLLGK